MIHKLILPLSFDFGVPSVLLIGVGQKGLDKQAMLKRASAFDDVIGKIEKKANREYLHVITTGAMLKYGANANCFIAGTKVEMFFDGGGKSILDIRPGLKVIAGDSNLHKVVRTIANLYSGELVEVLTEAGHVVTMTANHPVALSAKLFVEASKLTTNDKLLLVLPFGVFKKIAIRNINKYQVHETPVYNLLVEEEHTYCVPFLVHNCDAFNEDEQDILAELPEDEKKIIIHLDGGLKKYHDSEYMKNGAVYQLHKTKRNGAEPSGLIIAARYNPEMHRGLLIIAVDAKKWAPRLQRKANGNDIYLSMGCDVQKDTCLPKGTLVHTAYGYRPIESIELGDFVYARDNKLHEVTQTFERQTDTKTRMHITGIPLEFECTPNHPIEIVRRDQIRDCIGFSCYRGQKVKRRHAFTKETGNQCIVCKKLIEPATLWVRADDVKVGDFTVARTRSNADHDTRGASFAYLCGMYLGDGSMLTLREGNHHDGGIKFVGISITASAKEQDEGIIEKIKKHFLLLTGKTAICYPYKTKNAIDVNLHDRLLATRIYLMCGTGSRTKRLSPEIQTWSANLKAAFIAGYLDSDGNINKLRGHIRLATVNRGLALQVQQLCWSIGIRATVSNAGELCGFGGADTAAYGAVNYSYAVNLYYCLDILPKYSAKLEYIGGDFCTKSHYKSSTLHINDMVLLPVTETRTFSCAPVSVYNIAVLGDPTYNAEGITVHNCSVCGHDAHTMDLHCLHFKKKRGQMTAKGTKICVINDAPHFYDISGVDVPADRIAFVLSKVASGAQVKEASLLAITSIGTRRPMPLYKAAATLQKLSNMLKEVTGIILGDKDDLNVLDDSDEAKKDFILSVLNFPSDEIIDTTIRKGILLSPEMLFKILGKDCEDEGGDLLCSCDDSSCGDLSTLFQDFSEDEGRDDLLLDGAFDSRLPVDLNLDSILLKFMPLFGVTRPSMQTKVIIINIRNRKPKEKKQTKEASVILSKSANALKNTYARYVISFAERNSDLTCFNALRKIARYGKY